MYHGQNGNKHFAGTCHPPSPLYVSRAAALAAGIPSHVPITTVNRLCSSGLMSIRTIAHAIQAGEITLGLAIGVESMSLKYVGKAYFSVARSHESSPRPTPELVDTVSSHSKAADAIQVSSFHSTRR